MSVQSRFQAAQRLSTIISKWPNDSHKIYSSFRKNQLKIYANDKPSELPAAEVLDLRSISAQRLLENVHFDAFKPDERIYSPDGNPLYYDLIKREANAERGRVGLVTAIKHTLFGWWRK